MIRAKIIRDDGRVLVMFCLLPENMERLQDEPIFVRLDSEPPEGLDYDHAVDVVIAFASSREEFLVNMREFFGPNTEYHVDMTGWNPGDGS